VSARPDAATASMLRSVALGALSASKEHASEYGDQIAVQPPPPPSMAVDRIRLDPRMPEESARIV
jgi:hypothetical protein